MTKKSLHEAVNLDDAFNKAAVRIQDTIDAMQRLVEEKGLKPVESQVHTLESLQTDLNGLIAVFKEARRSQK